MRTTERITRLNNDFALPEYACHEGNDMIRNWIAITQAEQKKK